MGENSRFQKMFFIFKQEDSGFGTNSEPGGHLKIETFDRAGKLSLSIHNIKEEKESRYVLYLLNAAINRFVYLRAGDIQIKGGKGSLQWDFDTEKLAGAGTSVEGINTCVVLVEHKYGSNGKLICPLAAYKDKKTNWRSALGKSLQTDTDRELSNYETDSIPSKEPERPEKNEQISAISIIEDEKNAGEKDSLSQNENQSNTDTIVEESRQRTKDSKIEMIKRELEGSFEACAPFSNTRKDYRWWKIDSPVQLNNLLYKYSISAPMLFNPKVLSAHYKHKYLIVGIFNDMLRNAQYIVCGVPGQNSVEDRPFGTLCRWVQAEGIRYRPGALGYWLIYIDPYTGRILRSE